MISCVFRGQLGNQMFIAATVIAHALKHNTDYCFPSRSGKRRQFEFMFPHLHINDSFVFDTYYKEQQFGVYNPILEPIGNQLLQGYFQSELYFKDYRKEVIAAFGLPKYLIRSNIVSIHIRRGDSLQFVNKLPQPSDRYLNQAIATFGSSYRFQIYSDDIEWCQSYHLFQGDKFEFMPKEQDPKLNMAMMASCEHNIIVNSTYSWWSGWLNENRDKVVIVPHQDNWFGNGILSAQDIIPKAWKQIKY